MCYCRFTQLRTLRRCSVGSQMKDSWPAWGEPGRSTSSTSSLMVASPQSWCPGTPAAFQSWWRWRRRVLVLGPGDKFLIFMFNEFLCTSSINLKEIYFVVWNECMMNVNMWLDIWSLILNLYNLPLLFSAMVRPKKVETLSVNERAKRWKKKNPQMVKLNKQKQKARELLKSQVGNLLC